MEIYLPRSWTEDSERRGEAGIPDTVFFRTKTQIAMSLTDRALEHGVRPAFLAADSGYGESGEFREFLRDKKLPYALQTGPDGVRVIDASVKTVPPGRGRRRETFPEHRTRELYSNPLIHRPVFKKPGPARHDVYLNAITGNFLLLIKRQDDRLVHLQFSYCLNKSFHFASHVLLT